MKTNSANCNKTAKGKPCPEHGLKECPSYSMMESKCNCTAKGKPCPEHGLKECPGYMEEGLKGGQKKLDKNHNGKLDGQDFKMLRGEKKVAEASAKCCCEEKGKMKCPVHKPMNETERTMSRAAKGYEKYGKEGMRALAQAGKDGKDLDKVRDKYNKYGVAENAGRELTNTPRDRLISRMSPSIDNNALLQKVGKVVNSPEFNSDTILKIVDSPNITHPVGRYIQKEFDELQYDLGRAYEDHPEEVAEKLLSILQDRTQQGVAEAAKHGLYYNVNKRKAAGTSRPASSPKAPTAQAWKDAAKTAKHEATAPKDLPRRGEKMGKEGNAFGKAVRDAKASGDKTVTVDGKTMPVKEEKWIKVHKSREGMFKGKGQAELQSMKAALKKRNAAKKERGEEVPEKDKTKMAQLNFALRAKKGHGIHESQFEIQEMINDYLTLKNMQRVDEEDLRTLNLITEEIAFTLENNLIPQPKTINESWTHDSLGKHLFENDVDLEEHGDTSGSMAKQQLFNAAQKAITLFKTIEDNDQLEPWVFYKINLATDYLDTVSEYLEYAAYEKNSQPGEMEVAPDDNYMESLAHKLYTKLRNI